MAGGSGSNLSAAAAAAASSSPLSVMAPPDEPARGRSVRRTRVHPFVCSKCRTTS